MIGSPELVLIERARPDDLAAVLALIEDCGLPTAGFEQSLPTTVVARAGASVVGCAAVELYGSDALLRSVAVADTYRGRMFARALVDHALDMAGASGVTRVFVLTETATRYFERMGFRAVARDLVPEAVRVSTEFTEVCPETAVAMEREL